MVMVAAPQNLTLVLLGRIAVLRNLRRCGLLLPTEYRGLWVCRSVVRSLGLAH